MELIIILTHLVGKEPLTPHLDALRASNPDADVRVVFDPLHRLRPREAWRQPDLLLQRWWRTEGREVKAEEITVMEWDCLVTVPVPAMSPDADVLFSFVGPLEGATASALYLGGWSPPVPPGLGLPFGFFQVRRWVLDELTSGRHNAAFRQSVQCETRLATLAASVGARVRAADWPGVRWRTDVIPDGPGIYHPVKSPVATR